MTKASTKVQHETEEPMSIIERYSITYYIPTIKVFLSLWLFSYFNGSPTPFWAFNTLLPFVDKFLPGDDFPVRNAKYHNHSKWNLIPVLTAIFSVWLSVIFFVVNYPCLNYDWNETVQFMLGFVMMTSGSISAAHQLFHRPQPYLKYITYPHMAIFWFSVYHIEHIYLHHKHVGTTQDFITCPKDKSLHKRTHFCLQSGQESLLCLMLYVAYFGSIFMYALNKTGDTSQALSILGFFALAGLIGFIVFEAAEYTEHYGLIFGNSLETNDLREKSSWNCDKNLVSNWMTFRVQRHQDHHVHAYKPYPSLEIGPNMPMLPTGILEAMIISFVPSLWYYIMHPYLEEVMGQSKVSKTYKLITDLVRHSIPTVLAVQCLHGLFIM